MQAYGIQYTVKGDDRIRHLVIDAKDMASARRKIGRRHGYKGGRMIKVKTYNIVGYF